MYSRWVMYILCTFDIGLCCPQCIIEHDMSVKKRNDQHLCCNFQTDEVVTALISPGKISKRILIKRLMPHKNYDSIIMLHAFSVQTDLF